MRLCALPAGKEIFRKRYGELIEYTVNRLIYHIIKGLRAMIKRRNGRHNHRTDFCCLRH